MLYEPDFARHFNSQLRLAKRLSDEQLSILEVVDALFDKDEFDAYEFYRSFGEKAIEFKEVLDDIKEGGEDD